MDIDFTEILGRALKYLMEGLAVGLACYFSKLKTDEIIIIAVTAAATFAILDMYTPQVSDAARMGTGFGIGSQFAGLKIISSGL
jgi:predicted transporter